MAKARKRYIVTGKKYINDSDMRGAVYQLVGRCDRSGEMKRPNGRPIFKKYQTHYLLQINDKKDLRERNLNLDTWHRIVVNEWSFDRFFEEVEDE